MATNTENVSLLDISFNVSEGMDGLDALIAKSNELAEKKKQLMQAMKEEQKSLSVVARAYKDGSVSQEEYKEAVSNTAKSQVDLKKQLIDVNDEIKDVNQDIKVNNTLMKSQADSANALRAQLQKNTKELNSMSAAERQTSEAGQELSAETKDISDRLKEMESSVGDNRRNVGNYTESLEQAINSSGNLGGVTGQLTGAVSGSTGAFKSMFTLLKTNPFVFIATVVISIIAAIEKLISRNSELTTALKGAFAPFEVILDRVLDTLTEFITVFATALTKAADGITYLAKKMGLLSDETIKAMDAARGLEQAQYDIYAAETANITAVSELRAKFADLRNISADQTKSMKERNEATAQSLVILDQIQEKELAVAQAKLDQIKAQNSLSYSSQEALREEAEAEKALNEMRRGFANERKGLISQQSGWQKSAYDADVAASKAAQAKKRADREASEKAALEASKKLLDEQMQVITDNLTALDLAHQEAELGKDDLDLRLQHEREYSEASLELFKTQLDNKLISQQEYDNKVTEARIAQNQIQLEIDAQNKATRDEAEAIDKANRLELAMADTTSEYERKQMALQAQYEQEKAAAEKVGADVSLIEEKFSKKAIKLKKEEVDSKLAMASGLAGQMSQLLGEESKAGKAFAVVQATINTYLGATKALATGGLLGIAKAAIVISFGLAQVASIVKQKEPDTSIKGSSRKFARGGQITGASHANGGVTFTGSNGQVFEAEGGENMYILKKSASSEINALSALNEAHGGRSFATSGLYKFAQGGAVAMANNLANTPGGTITLSNRSINQLANVMLAGIQSAPNPVVSVQDINHTQHSMDVVVRDSTVF